MKDKIKSEGAGCVFAKCMQHGCNVVVPHSFYLKYIKDEDEGGYNYYQKYMSWHGKQFTDINKNIKWCPDPQCKNIVEVKDVYS